MKQIIGIIHRTLVATTLIIGVTLGFTFSLGFLIDACRYNRLSTFGVSVGVAWLTWALSRGYGAFLNQDRGE